MTKSLWPDTIGLANEKVAPVSILKEQAAFLGQKTQNLVIAEVEPIEVEFLRSPRKDFINHAFYLVATALGNYRFELFRVSGSIVNLYPIKINADTLEMEIEIASEDELLKVLADIFSHPKTMEIVESMLVQSGWVAPMSEDEIPF